MPTIPDFPSDLLAEHRQWHRARHAVDPLRPPIGYGLDFLQFHRGYLQRALAWYRSRGYDPRLVEPWAAVPEPIRQSACYDRRAEARILLDPLSFATADELGRFIESSQLHNCIHQGAATLYGEPDLEDFDVAPRSTVFYQIHGMIDRWWQNWEGQGRFREGMSYWQGRFARDREDVLLYRPEDGSWWLGRIEDGRVAWDVAADLDDTRGYMDDGRPFRIWDIDGDGRAEVVCRSPHDGSWWEGRLSGGRLRWSRIRRLERVGAPASRYADVSGPAEAASVPSPDASRRKKRKTLM